MNNDRNHSWAITALGDELKVLEQMPEHKVGQPGSPYSISLLKIASIIKGAGAGYFPSGVVFISIRQASYNLHVPEKESMRMWSRAMKNARPRFPQE